MVGDHVGWPLWITLVGGGEEEAVDRLHNSVGKANLSLLMRLKGFLPKQVDDLAIVAEVHDMIRGRGDHQVQEADRVQVDFLRLWVRVALKGFDHLALTAFL